MFRTKADVDNHAANIFAYTKLVSERAEKSYDIAELYISVGDFDSALQYINKYLSVYPKHAAAYKILGEAYEGLRHVQKALTAYKRSVQLNSRQPDLVSKLLLLENPNFTHNASQYCSEQTHNLQLSIPIDLSSKELSVDIISESNTSVNRDMDVSAVKGDVYQRDVNQQIQLLKMYVARNRLEVAFQHAVNIETTGCFSNDISWYRCLSTVMREFCQNFPAAAESWEFHYYNIRAFLQRMTLSSCHYLMEEHLLSLLGLDQAMFEASKLLKKKNSKLLQSYVKHASSLLCLHFGIAVLNLGLKSKHGWREYVKQAQPLLLLAAIPRDDFTSIETPELESQIKLWGLEADFCRSQAVHVVLAMVHENINVFLNRVQQFCSPGWRKKFYQNISCGRPEDAVVKSFFVSYDNFENIPRSLPSPSVLLASDIRSAKLYPDCLHHLVWIGLQNWARAAQSKKNVHGSDSPLAVFRLSWNYCCPVFEKLVCSSDKDYVDQLDMDAFLYASVYCAVSTFKRDLERGSTSDDAPPTVLPADLTEPLCSIEQSEWWSAAWQSKERNATLIQKGVDLVRVHENHGLDVRLVVLLAKIFENKAEALDFSPEANRFEARAHHYWTTALELLQRKSTASRSEMFRFAGEELSPRDVKALIEEGKFFLACQLKRAENFGEAAKAFSELASPLASFYEAQMYMKMADKVDFTSKSNFLLKAKSSLDATKNRLRQTLHPEHPLCFEVEEHVVEVERELLKVVDANDGRRRPTIEESTNLDQQLRTLATTEGTLLNSVIKQNQCVVGLVLKIMMLTHRTILSRFAEMQHDISELKSVKEAQIEELQQKFSKIFEEMEKLKLSKICDKECQKSALMFRPDNLKKDEEEATPQESVRVLADSRDVSEEFRPTSANESHLQVARMPVTSYGRPLTVFTLPQRSSFSSPTSPNFQPQPNFPSQPNFSPQPNFPSQPNFPPQQNFPLQPNFSPQQNFPSQPSFPSQKNFSPQPIFPTQQNFSPHLPSFLNLSSQQNFSPRPNYPLTPNYLPMPDFPPRSNFPPGMNGHSLGNYRPMPNVLPMPNFPSAPTCAPPPSIGTLSVSTNSQRFSSAQTFSSTSGRKTASSIPKTPVPKHASKTGEKTTMKNLSAPPWPVVKSVEKGCSHRLGQAASCESFAAGLWWKAVKRDVKLSSWWCLECKSLNYVKVCPGCKALNPASKQALVFESQKALPAISSPPAHDSQSRDDCSTSEESPPCTPTVEPPTSSSSHSIPSSDVEEEADLFEGLYLPSTASEALSSSDTDVVLPSSDTDVVLPSSDTDVVLPSSDTDVVLPSSDTDVVLPLSDTDVVLPSSDTDVVLPSSDTDVVLPSSDTDVVLPSSDTDVVLPSSDTDVVLPSSDTDVVLPSSDTDVVLPSSDTDVVLPSSDTNVVSPSSDTDVLLSSSNFSPSADSSDIQPLMQDTAISHFQFTGALGVFVPKVAKIETKSKEEDKNQEQLLDRLAALTSDGDKVFSEGDSVFQSKKEQAAALEEEELLFCETGRLFRYTVKEWLHSGVGEVKIWHHRVHKSYRLEMKSKDELVLNHKLTEDIVFRRLKKCDRSWLWSSVNLIEQPEVPGSPSGLEGISGVVSVRFEVTDTARKFEEVVCSCQKQLLLNTDLCADKTQM